MNIIIITILILMVFFIMLLALFHMREALSLEHMRMVQTPFHELKATFDVILNLKVHHECQNKPGDHDKVV